MSNLDDFPIRQLPAVQERVETGVTRFGTDWPGVFIRGDNAMVYKLAIEKLLDLPSDAQSKCVVAELGKLLAKSNLTDRE